MDIELIFIFYIYFIRNLKSSCPSPVETILNIRSQARPGHGQWENAVYCAVCTALELVSGIPGFDCGISVFPSCRQTLFIKLYLTEVWTSYALIATYRTKVTNQIRSNKYWVTLPQCGLTALQTFYFWQDKNYVSPLQDMLGPVLVSAQNVFILIIVRSTKWKPQTILSTFTPAGSALDNRISLSWQNHMIEITPRELIIPMQYIPALVLQFGKPKANVWRRWYCWLFYTWRYLINIFPIHSSPCHEFGAISTHHRSRCSVWPDFEWVEEDDDD